MINDMVTPKTRHCPHCRHEISVREAIVILREASGGAYELVRSRTPDGIEAILEIGEANPFVTELTEL